MPEEESGVGTRLLGTKDAQKAVDSFTAALNSLSSKVKGLASAGGAIGRDVWNGTSNWSGGNNGGSPKINGGAGSVPDSPAYGGYGNRGSWGSTSGSGSRTIPQGQGRSGSNLGTYAGNVLGGGPNGGGSTFGGKAAATAGGIGATFSALAGYGSRVMPDQVTMDQVASSTGTLAGNKNGVAGRAMYVKAAFGSNAIATSYTDAGEQFGTNVYSSGGSTGMSGVSGQRYNQAVGNTYGIGYGSPTMGGAASALAQAQMTTGRSYFAAASLGYSPMLQAGGKFGSMSSLGTSIMQRTFGKNSIANPNFQAAMGQGGSLDVNINALAQQSGWSDSTTQGVKNYLTAQNAAATNGITGKKFDDLMTKAGTGDKSAQATLAKAGVNQSGYQSLKDWNAAKMGQQSDLNQNFTSSLQSAADAATKFTDAMTKFLNIPAINQLVGGGSALSSIGSQALGGIPGNIAATYFGGKAIGAVGKSLATKVLGRGAATAATDAVTGGTEALGAGGAEAAGGSVLAGAALPVTAVVAASYAAGKTKAFQQQMGHGAKDLNAASASGIGVSNLMNTISGFRSGGFSGAWNGLFGSPDTSVGSPISDAATGGAPGATAGQPSKSVGGPTGKFPRSGAGVVMAARSAIGTPYSSSLEENGKGFGCATLAHWCYKQIGVSIPPDLSNNQFKVGTPVDKNAIMPGDLVFFYYANGVNTENKVNHVGIAVGGGQMIAAPHTGAFVHQENIDWNHYMGARRYVGSGGSLAPSVTTNAAGANGASGGAGTGGTDGSGTSGEPGAWSGAGSNSEADNIASALGGGAGGASGTKSGNAAASTGNANATSTAGVTAGAPKGVSAAMLAGPVKGANTAKGMNLMATILQAGFTKGANANMAYAISMAESSGNPGETHVNSDKHRSVDEGLFQLNNYWHPEVDQKRVFDPLYNAQQAFRISHGGTNWKGWSTFTGNMYEQFLNGGGKGYKVGAWEIPQDQSTTVHRGEMILDQRSADTVRAALLKANVAGGGGSGGGSGHIIFSEGSIKLNYSGPATPDAAQAFGKQVATAISDDARIKKIMAGV